MEINPQLEIRKLIGLRVVEVPEKKTDVTMQQIYDFAEKVHPLRASHPAMLRVLEPNQSTTDDHHENRLNIILDNNIIVQASWG